MRRKTGHRGRGRLTRQAAGWAAALAVVAALHTAPAFAEVAVDVAEPPVDVDAGGVVAQDAEVVPAALDTPSQMRVVILSAGERHGVDVALMLRIAECESRLNPRAVGPGGAAGLFQFMPATWEWAALRAGMGGAAPLDPIASAEVAAWLLKTAGPSQWSCA